MRRWMHSLIVALLCLTLFVDTAKACWFLRHRCRAQACRPVACRPACPPPCCVSAWPESEPVAEHSVACHSATEVVVDAGSATPSQESVIVEQATLGEPATPHESVVEHGPTLVVAPTPTAPAGEPSSVVTAPAVETPAPAAAQPMPLAAAPLPVPQPQAAPQKEPLPDLKPALPTVAPASNDEPVIEPSAPTASPAKPAASLADAGAEEAPATTEPAADAPMPAEPAPVTDLAGGPDLKAPTPEPQEPNLFDLYGDDEGDDEGDAEPMPAEEPRDEMPEEAADAATDEQPAEEAAEPAAADDEEMTDEDAPVEETADTVEGDTPESDPPAEDAPEDAPEETAPAAPTQDEEEAGAAAPETKPAAAESDPFAGVFAVPNEPMRRWTDDTGTRHVQGWLVELRADRVRILKVNGRHTTVTMESLSAEDRDYVSAVGDRLAAEREGSTPATTTTAGL